MPFGLDPTPGELAEMGRLALALVERYYADLTDLPVMPDTTAEAVRRLLASQLPRDAAPFEDVLATVRDVVYPFSRHNGHPRFFGYVASPGTAVASLADLLAAALNANVTSWRSAPAAAEMEHVVIDWFKSILGYPESAAGLLVSGGSMANFSALAAAHSAKAPEAARTGRSNRPLRVYVSEEGHFSIHKAARLLGIGSDNVQSIPTDSDLRIDLDDLERRIRADEAAGFLPACVVANAGTVNTGAFDPLPEIAAIAERHGLWFHVDGAYGGFSALAPSAKPLFHGIERADSVALDPHKWLYSSLGCGCVLYRDPASARAAFAHDAEYTRPVGLARDEAFAFWDYGPELSRPFRALTVWFQLKVYGADAVARSIEHNIGCARYFAGLVQQSDDFEMLAPAGLSIFCFGARESDAVNERILIELQRSGSSYLSNARVHDRFALRGCVLNHRTSERDMDRLFDDVRAASARVRLRP